MNRGDVLYLIKSTWARQKQTRMVQMKWAESKKNYRSKRKSTTKIRNYNLFNIVYVCEAGCSWRIHSSAMLLYSNLSWIFHLLCFQYNFFFWITHPRRTLPVCFQFFVWFHFSLFFSLSLLLLRTETSCKFSANKENSPSFQLVVLLSALNFRPFIYLFSYSFIFLLLFWFHSEQSAHVWQTVV